MTLTQSIYACIYPVLVLRSPKRASMLFFPSHRVRETLPVISYHVSAVKIVGWMCVAARRLPILTTPNKCESRWASTSRQSTLNLFPPLEHVAAVHWTRTPQHACHHTPWPRRRLPTPRTTPRRCPSLSGNGSRRPGRSSSGSSCPTARPSPRWASSSGGVASGSRSHSR